MIVRLSVFEQYRDIVCEMADRRDMGKMTAEAETKYERDLDILWDVMTAEERAEIQKEIP